MLKIPAEYDRQFAFKINGYLSPSFYLLRYKVILLVELPERSGG
jgi:hypothetical protein